MTSTALPELRPSRASWMRLLALAGAAELEALAGAYAETPHVLLRSPETGMVMLRGRMGGSGAAFNLGEATVTRCAIRLADGPEGHSYVMGRNARHALLAALCDALLQVPDLHEGIRAAVLDPISETLRVQKVASSAKTAATKVDFFTMVRGDD